MKDSGSLHQQVQAMCDCYATSDPLKELSTIDRETDAHQAAVKGLALAALHGVAQHADKITITRDHDGQVRVVAEYRPTELPAPGAAVGQNMIDLLRQITHIEGDKGKTALALGIRDSRIDLEIKIKRKEGEEKVTIGFP